MRKPEPVPFEVRKMAVLRANGIGDFLFALPALAALRHTYPAAEIVLLALEWHAAFLADRPSCVDRTLVVPEYRGVGATEDAAEEPARIDAFFDSMQRERFDVAFQLHGGGRFSNPFVARLGARLTVGLKAPDAMPLDRWVPYVYFQPEIFRYLEAVGLVGASPVGLDPEVAITDRDLQESKQLVPPDDRPMVVLSPGAGDPRRRWSPSRFAALGDRLWRAGFRVVVTGASSDVPLVEAVCEQMTGPCEGVSSLSLGGLGGLLRRAHLSISNDSGPLHLARAVGVPTIGIYWCANLITAGPAWRKDHRPAVSWRLNCLVCDQNIIQAPCSHRASFVDDVTVDEVFGYCLELATEHIRPLRSSGQILPSGNSAGI